MRVLNIKNVNAYHSRLKAWMPDDFDAQLNVRLWERLLDLYVMDPMQRYIAQLLRPEAKRDALAMQASVDGLARA